MNYILFMLTPAEGWDFYHFRDALSLPTGLGFLACMAGGWLYDRFTT